MHRWNRSLRRAWLILILGTGPAAAQEPRTHRDGLLDVRDRGAVCDGASHPLPAGQGAATPGDEADWAAIQAGIVEAERHGGGTVLVPYGHCLLSRPLTISGTGVQLVGGSRQTILTFTDPAADSIRIGADPASGSKGAQIGNIKIADLYLDHRGKTAGAALRARGVAHLEVSNVTIDHPWDGIDLERVNDVQLSHLDVNDFQHDGYRLHADPAANERSDGIVLSNVVAQGRYLRADGTGRPIGSCLVIDGPVYSVDMSTVRLLGCTNGLVLNNSAGSDGAYPQFVQAFDLETDGISRAGLLINSVYRFECISCDLQNTSGAHLAEGQDAQDEATVQINPDAAHSRTRAITFIGGRIGNSWRSAIAIGGSEVSLDGTQVSDASKAGPGRFPAILIRSTARDVQVHGARIGTMFGEGRRASHCVEVEDGATSILVTGNRCQGSVAEDFRYGGADPSVVLRDNLGSDRRYR